jgi:hypothetical protein
MPPRGRHTRPPLLVRASPVLLTALVITVGVAAGVAAPAINTAIRRRHHQASPATPEGGQSRRAGQARQS